MTAGVNKRQDSQQEDETTVRYGLQKNWVIISFIYYLLYNNQINARALIGQSAVVYCASKPTEKSRVF